MKERIVEIIAVLSTIAGGLFATVWPFFHEANFAKSAGLPGARVITLTGVAKAGIWTEEEVDASNYWSASFLPACPSLRPGEPVLLRLKSADVVHTFYCPGLGVGPVEVYPGHLVQVPVTPVKEGVYEYYCTTFCGDPHFGMRGRITVGGVGVSPPAQEAEDADRYWLESPPAGGGTRVEQGRWLYVRMGCVNCHGPEGRGGVPNWNYVKDTVPPLNTLAERLMLFEPEDVEIVVEKLEQQIDLKDLVEDPPVPRFNVVLAQLNSVRDVIRKGNPAGKKDPEGPAPPLEMPAWSQRLSAANIDSVIAYLLTLYPWEEEVDDYDGMVDDTDGGEEEDQRKEQGE